MWKFVDKAAGILVVAASGLGGAPVLSQDALQMDHGTSDDAHDHHAATHEAGTNIPAFSDGSGTSRVPGTEGAMQGSHSASGNWTLMAHGFVSAQYTDESGPRGDDKLYSTSMAMLSAESRTNRARLRLKSMISLEPAMSDYGYPNLFATGETAGGAPLVDRQHPHDLFMELAARIDWILAPGTSAFVYAGPVGEPALGPSAFMHRGTAAHNPNPPIAHHWFDSTHITYGVVTAGLSTGRWQLEASAFRGEEPDEQRWDIEAPRLDSWSVRASFTPSPRWALQASYAELDEPEALHPGLDERRYTASIHHSTGRLSTLMAFSAKDRVPGATFTAWLGELNWKVDQQNSLFARIENVLNNELFPDHHDPLHDLGFRVTKLQLGYARHLPITGAFSLTLGASASVYDKPGALDAAYGSHPFGYTLFARFNVGH